MQRWEAAKDKLAQDKDAVVNAACVFSSWDLVLESVRKESSLLAWVKSYNPSQQQGDIVVWSWKPWKLQMLIDSPQQPQVRAGSFLFDPLAWHVMLQ